MSREADMVMMDMVTCVGRGPVLRTGEWELAAVAPDGLAGEVADQPAIQNPTPVGPHWRGYHL